MTVHPIGVHIGPGLTDDNELLDGGPLARAAEMDADLERIQRGLGVSDRTTEAATAVISAPSSRTRAAMVSSS